MPRESWQAVLAKWPAELKLSEEDAKKPRREVYKNIQTAPDTPAGGLPMAMSIYTAVLGVTCEYCHVPGRWESDEKAPKRTVRTMLGLFDEMPRYFEEAHQPIMQCYTCHQGSLHPERKPNG
jgi:hypothetical protein